MIRPYFAFVSLYVSMFFIFGQYHWWYLPSKLNYRLYMFIVHNVNTSQRQRTITEHFHMTSWRPCQHQSQFPNSEICFSPWDFFLGKKIVYCLEYQLLLANVKTPPWRQKITSSTYGSTYTDNIVHVHDPKLSSHYHEKLQDNRQSMFTEQQAKSCPSEHFEKSVSLNSTMRHNIFLECSQLKF